MSKLESHFLAELKHQKPYKILQLSKISNSKLSKLSYYIFTKSNVSSQQLNYNGDSGNQRMIIMYVS